MATNKNITMKQFNGIDYDTLYPKTIASQIDDVYSKSEVDAAIQKAGMKKTLVFDGNTVGDLVLTNLPEDTKFIYVYFVNINGGIMLDATTYCAGAILGWGISGTSSATLQVVPVAFNPNEKKIIRNQAVQIAFPGGNVSNILSPTMVAKIWAYS